jgi:hypothetical protein
MSIRTIAEPLLDAETRLEGFDNLVPFQGPAKLAIA